MTIQISKNITSRLMTWFEDHRRVMPWRGSKDPYHIWVSEMMLQQTQVAIVEKYYPKWIAHFPDVFSLAEAPLDDVLKVWEGLGYYTRARNFHKGAQYIVALAESRDDPFPKTYDTWLHVPGVGPYTAAAVSSIAFGYPAGVVDANVMRVMARLFCIEKNIATQLYRREVFSLMNRGFYDHHPGWVNQAWMELGSLQCTSNPDCARCPLKEHCCAHRQTKVSSYPIKTVKKTIPTRRSATFIIYQDRRYLMVQRRPEGFLGGLWECPGYTLKQASADKDHFISFIRKNHIKIEKKHPKPVLHSYSHFHQIMDVYFASLEGKWKNKDWGGMRWVNKEELEKLPRSRICIKLFDSIK